MMKVTYRKQGQMEEHKLDSDASEIIIELIDGTRISISSLLDTLRIHEVTWRGLMIHPVANNSFDVTGDENAS